MRTQLSKSFIGTSLALLFLFAIGMSSSLITSRDPLKTGYALGLSPGSPDFIMGTDQLGRDVFSWVIHGIRVAFYVGGASTLISFAIALLGIFAGYYGGLLDQILMRVTDLAMSVPRFVLVVVLATLFGTSFQNLVLIIGGLSWPTLARIMRAETLSLREREFVLSAKVTGCNPVDIMFFEIFPNILPPVLPTLALQFSRSIIDEIGISFLGLGDPNLPSWGKLIAIGRQAIFAGGWWVLVYPCVVCVAVLLCANSFADRLNDALNPKMQSVGQ